MPTSADSTPGCPLDGPRKIAGNGWSILILRDAFYGVRHFDGFQRHPGISKKMLAQRLRRLSQGLCTLNWMLALLPQMRPVKARGEKFGDSK